MIDRLTRKAAHRLQRFSKRRSRINLYAWIEEALLEFGWGARAVTVNIGAGGEVGELLERAGLRPLSIDTDPSRRPDLIADITNLSTFGDASVDGVTCIEVLEHVKDPQLAVKELYRILKPGGVVVGSTPFLLGIHDEPNDYFRFTGYGIRTLFADFQVLHLRERNGYFDAISVLILRRFAVQPSQRAKRTALLLSPVLLALACALQLLGRLMPSADGTTGYFFVCRKPTPVLNASSGD